MISRVSTLKYLEGPVFNKKKLKHTKKQGSMHNSQEKEMRETFSNKGQTLHLLNKGRKLTILNKLNKLKEIMKNNYGKPGE